MAMLYKCKKCKGDMHVIPLQYEQSPYCSSCYHVRLKQFLESNDIPAVRECFGFRKSQKKAAGDLSEK